MARQTKAERSLERMKNATAAAKRRLEERNGGITRMLSATAAGGVFGAAAKKGYDEKATIAGVKPTSYIALGAAFASFGVKDKTMSNILEGVAAGAGAVGAFREASGATVETEERAEGEHVEGAPVERRHVQPPAIEGPAPRRRLVSRRPRRRGDALEELIEDIEEQLEEASYEDVLDAAE